MITLGALIDVFGHNPVAQSTRDLLGQQPSQFDPSLGIPWNKRKIVQAMKQKELPYRNGMEGIPIRCGQ